MKNSYDYTIMLTYFLINIIHCIIPSHLIMMIMLRIRSTIDHILPNTRCSGYVITPTYVRIGVNHLKSGKWDGFERLCSDHFINGTKGYIYYVFLSIILTLFLSHGFTPDSLILGTMIPIPKENNKYFCSSSNYRAIALSSILNKILDWIILLKEHKSLSGSLLQFGFKKGISTTQCTHRLLEIVDYYNYNKSDVFVLMLDASKAFDRVRYCKFFNELLDRDISPVFS